MLAARACDVRIARRAAHSRQQMRGRDRHCDRRRLQHIALVHNIWLDELEPTLTVARQQDRVTVVGIGEADERVVGKRWRKAAREIVRQHHRLTVGVGERRRVPAVDVQIGRMAVRVWNVDVATNLIVILLKYDF